MKVAIYQENGLFYIGKEIFAAGICSLLFNNDNTQVEIRIAKDRSEVVDMQPITDYTTKEGVDYANINELLAAVPGFFAASIQSINLATNDLGRDAWGRPKVINDFTLFSALWTFNVTNRDWIHMTAPKTPGYPYTEIAGGIPKDNSNKYISSKNGYLSVVSDGTNNTHCQSKRHIRYQPNKGYLYSSAHILPNPNQVGFREFGLNNGQSGVFFKLEGTGTEWKMYGCKTTTIGGVKDRQCVDITDAILKKIPTFDPSKGHVYDIQMQWRGVGDFMFYVDLQRIYTNNMLGTLTGMSVNNPALNVGFSCYGADSDIELITGCVDITSEGGHKSNKKYISVNTPESLVVTSRNGNDGTAILAIKIPNSIDYHGNLVDYTRDLAFLRFLSFNKDEYVTSLYYGRLVDATNLDNISDNSDPLLGWTDVKDSYFKYMIGGNSTALDIAFKSDKAASKLSRFISVRNEKDYHVSIANPDIDQIEFNLSGGDVFILIQRPDGTNQLGGGTLEFAEEV